MFVVKDDDDDDDDEGESSIQQASMCQADSSVSHASDSLRPAQIFAADSGTVAFERCCLKA